MSLAKIKKAAIHRIVSLTALGSSCSAQAEPIFKDVAAEFGVGYISDSVAVLRDSRDANISYLLPREFTGSMQGFPFGPPIVEAVLQRWQDEAGLTHFSFLAFPRLNLFETTSFALAMVERHEANSDFFIEPLECLAAQVSFDGVPPDDLSAVRVRSVTSELDLGSGTLPALPPGYVYSIDFVAKKPDAFQATLLQLGANGAAELTCAGYSEIDDPAGPPATIKHAIPISIEFSRAEIVVPANLH